jgi:hypothetical protein
MRKALNILITGLALLLFLPTVLILASWNSLPGDFIYPVKIGLEKIAAAILSGTSVERQLQVGFAERRFSEADRLLVEQKSTIGFAALITQAETAKKEIVQTQDVTAKEKLVANLTAYEQRLEARKIEVAPSPPPANKSSPNPTKESSPSPTSKPTPAPLPNTEEVVATIEQTQEKLKEIKKELEKEVKEQVKEEKQEQPGYQREKEDNQQEKGKTGRK